MLMDIDSLRSQWVPYEQLVSSDVIAETLKMPQRLLPEKIDRITPNIELDSDGPVIRGVFVFTDSYMAEIRLEEQGEDFDAVLKNTVSNYRLQLGQHEVIRNAAAIEAAKVNK